MKQYVLIVVLSLSVCVIAEDSISAGSASLKSEIQKLQYMLIKTQNEIEELKTSMEYILNTLYYMDPKAAEMAEKAVLKTPLNEADKEYIQKKHGWK